MPDKKEIIWGAKQQIGTLVHLEIMRWALPKRTCRKQEHASQLLNTDDGPEVYASGLYCVRPPR